MNRNPEKRVGSLSLAGRLRTLGFSVDVQNSGVGSSNSSLPVLVVRDDQRRVLPRSIERALRRSAFCRERLIEDGERVGYRLIPAAEGSNEAHER
jgi:hypothetical protein